MANTSSLLALITSSCGETVGENRRNLLLALRDNSDAISRFVAENLDGWAMQFAWSSEAGQCQTNPPNDVPIIVAHLQKHFAAEIQSLPAPRHGTGT